MPTLRTCAVSERARKRGSGAFYTPVPIVDAVIRQTVEPLLASWSSSDLPRILDPACGDGAFLAAAFQSILTSNAPPGQEKSRPSAIGSVARGAVAGAVAKYSPGALLRASIFGVDVDPVAVTSCRQALGKLCGARQHDFEANIRSGNALFGSDFTPPPGRLELPFHGPYLDWSTTFPVHRFDAIIGNPPWLALAGRFAPTRVPTGVRAYLADRFGAAAYLPNLFGYFVSLSLELLNEGGYLGLLLPDRLAFNRQYTALRERLLRETCIQSLHFGVDFPGVTADAMLLVCRKAACPARHRIEIRERAGLLRHVPQQRLQQTDEHQFERGLTPALQIALGRMEDPQRSRPLRELVRITSGFGGRSELFTRTRTGPGQVRALKGSSIRRYERDAGFWFPFRRDNLTGRTVDPAKLGASPRVLVRKTGASLIATYDESAIFPDQSLYLLHDAPPPFDLRFLVGVLNSRPLDGYFRARCLTNRHSIAQVKTADLGRLPVPRLDLSRRQDRRFHDAVVALVQQRLEVGPGEKAAALEAEIDSLVSKKLGLASLSS